MVSVLLSPSYTHTQRARSLQWWNLHFRCVAFVVCSRFWRGLVGSFFDDVGGAAANSAHAWFRTSLLEMDLRIRSVQGYYCKFSLCALSTNIKAIRTHISQVVFHFDVKSNKIFRSLLLFSWKNMSMLTRQGGKKEELFFVWLLFNRIQEFAWDVS